MKFKRFKKNNINFWKIFIILVLFLGSIISMVFGSLNLSKNNDQKGFFGDTYSIFFDVDVSGKTSTEEQKKLVEDSSKSFSNWLLYKNISNTSVQSELIQSNDGILSNNFGRIYADLQNIAQVEYRGDIKNKNPLLVLLETLNTSRLTIEQYKPTANNDGFGNSDEFKYSTKLIQSNINADSATKDTRTERNNFGVALNLNTNLNINIFNNEKQTPPTAPAKPTEWYVFQNKDILIDKLNYSKKVAFDFKNQNQTPDTTPEASKNKEKIIFNYNTLPDDLKSWADAALSTDVNRDIISDTNLLKFYVESKDDTNTSKNPNANSNLAPIVENYLLTRNETSKAINYENYNNWFPTANFIETSTTFNNSELRTIDLRVTTAPTTDISKLSIQTGSENAQTGFIYEMKNTVISAPLKFSKSSSISDYAIFGNSLIIKPFLDKSLTSLSSYNMMFISFSIVLLIIAIIVCILYRVPGFFGSFFVVTSAIISSSILVLLKINFSIPSLIGLFIGVIISTICVVSFMEKIRKYTKESQSVFDSIQTSIKKSLMLFIDLHVSTILFGLMLVFIGKTDIIDMGLTLILFSLISFICVFLLFVAPLFLISDIKNNPSPKIFIFMRKNSTDFSWSFKKTQNIFYGIVPISIVLIIIAIALSFTIGVKNSFIYNDGTVIYLHVNPTSLANLNVSQVIGALPGSWINVTLNDNIISASSVDVYNKDLITQALASLTNITFTDINIAITSPSAYLDLAKATTLAILAGFGLNLVYYVFRLNVISVIPIFIVNCLSTLLCASISYLSWMFIDLFFIYAITFLAILSNIVSVLFISTSKTKFVKNKVYSKEEIQNFIFLNIKETFRVFIFIFFIAIISSFIFMGTISSLTIWLFAYLVLGSFISLLFTFFTISIFYYFAILIRQKYVRNILASISEKISHKKIIEVDEELISTINKFH
ncbi:MAG: hypothetical protein RR803_00240 [Malacoplasma sp.]